MNSLMFIVFSALILNNHNVDAVCTSSRVTCKTNTTFTFCIDLGYATVNLDYVTLECPAGLYCNQLASFPCVEESELPTTGISQAKPITTPTTSIITQSANPNSITTTISYLPQPTTLLTMLTTDITSKITSTSITSSLGTTQLQTGTTEEIKLPTQAPGQTATSAITTTEVPPKPVCPNPPPANPPACKQSGSTHPGPVCTKYYECIPVWLKLEPKETTCPKGKAYSATQKKCVTPQNGCVCAA